MKWSQSEIEILSPILQQMQADLEPLDGKQVLVLCSAAGDIAFRLAERMNNGKVTGLEFNEDLIEVARNMATARGLGHVVDFQKTEKSRIPLPDETFDALVSEFIVFPTPTPTQIGQPEMARVLKSGGKMVISDVIVTKPIPPAVRNEFEAIGLDYLCDGTQDDFRRWMTQAGLTNVEIMDFTPVVRKVWQEKQDADKSPDHNMGYSYLLQNPEFRLGEAIFYIYVRGEKP